VWLSASRSAIRGESGGFSVPSDVPGEVRGVESAPRKAGFPLTGRRKPKEVAVLHIWRKRGESVVIGEGADRITVTVSPKSSPGSVKLAIEAPKHIPIVRSELLERAA
jgi:carbon storage regulator CsrA